MQPSKSHKSGPTGAIIGGIAGGLCILIAFLLLLRCRRKAAKAPNVAPDFPVSTSDVPVAASTAPFSEGTERINYAVMDMPQRSESDVSSHSLFRGNNLIGNLSQHGIPVLRYSTASCRPS